MRSITGGCARRTLRASVFVVFAALAMALPIQATAGADLPLKGQDSGAWGIGSHDCGTLVPVFVETTGTATHLGRYAYSSQECVNFGNATYAGSWRMVAASGDRIQGTYAGTYTVDGTTIVYEQTNTITGGTGRFTGASGSFEISGLAFADFSGTQELSGSISS